MTHKVRDVMTNAGLCQLDSSQPVSEAARTMRDKNIGDVLVTRNGQLAGILTDRDLVVRCIAVGADPKSTPIGEVCSGELATVSPDDEVDVAVRLMAEKAIRRIPVVEHEDVRGIVSIGDLAQSRDPRSALGGISSAPPNL